MKTMCFILCFPFLSAGCNKLFPDEELALPRKNYDGDELKIGGYYYCDSDVGGTIVKFLYRNGIIISGYHHSTVDLNEVEIEMVKEYDLLKEDKSRWGVFEISKNTIEYEGWSTSVGGGLPVYKCVGIIENDTTIRIIKHINKKDNKEFPQDYKYHFRKFSPKPDSTNNFIK